MSKLLLMGAGTETPSGGGNGWSSKTITIDHTKCGSANSTNFPILFSGTYTYLKTTGNGGSVTSVSGYDIAFFSDSGLTTMLKFERVAWDATTGACQFWVKIPTLSSSVDTVIYLAYGNASITTDQQDIVNTWNTDFAAVWHMEEDPSGSAPQILDATSNNNDLTSGNMVSGDSVTGEITKGLNFTNAGNKYLTVASPSFNNWTNLAVEWWFKAPIANQAVTRFWEWTDTGLLLSGIGYPVTDKKAYIYCNGTTNAGATDVGDDTWHHAMFTSDGTNHTLYIDTVSYVTQSAAINGATGAFQVSRYGLGTGYSIDAIQDEMRVYKNFTPNSSWITSSFNSQSSPSTFYTIT